jgi:hypothetical protein
VVYLVVLVRLGSWPNQIIRLDWKGLPGIDKHPRLFGPFLNYNHKRSHHIGTLAPGACAIKYNGPVFYGKWSTKLASVLLLSVTFTGLDKHISLQRNQYITCP